MKRMKTRFLYTFYCSRCGFNVHSENKGIVVNARTVHNASRRKADVRGCVSRVRKPCDLLKCSDGLFCRPDIYQGRQRELKLKASRRKVTK